MNEIKVPGPEASIYRIAQAISMLAYMLNELDDRLFRLEEELREQRQRQSRRSPHG